MSLYVVPDRIINVLKKKSMIGEDKPSFKLEILDGTSWRVIDDVLSISCSKEKGKADVLSIELDNKRGKYTPERSEKYPFVFTPNARVRLSLGYGNALTQYFLGLIDNIEVKKFPETLRFEARSMYKKALDQTIKYEKDGRVYRTIKFENENLDDIFVEVAKMAGWKAEDIVLDEEGSGIILSAVEFSWETYADALQWIADTAGFDIIVDEYGRIHFKYPSLAQPAVVNKKITLPYEVEHDVIVVDSVYITSLDGAKVYKKDIDYSLVKEEDGSILIVDKDIGGQEILLSYVFPAWSFKEGVDIVEAGYRITDENYYSEIIVHGEKDYEVIDEDGRSTIDREVITHTKKIDETNSPYMWGRILKLRELPEKTLKIDSREAQTEKQCEILANRSFKSMGKNCRTAEHTAIANPWIKLGDVIQIYVDEMISDAYVILKMDIELSARGFIMDITSAHVGEANIIEEETA